MPPGRPCESRDPLKFEFDFCLVWIPAFAGTTDMSTHQIRLTDYLDAIPPLNIPPPLNLKPET